MAEPVDKRAQVHICSACASPLVQPQDWTHVDDEHWEVTLRCPECFESYAMVLTQEDVNALSYSLEEGFQSLLDAVDQLDREAFEAECQQFIEAVWSNNIYPMDF
ncbi:MAG: hypothetical protein M5U22_14210 [Thermoleophilia bacterium]|nr:hypothetical protein [Thermoleophilia bacterium]